MTGKPPVGSLSLLSIHGDGFEEYSWANPESTLDLHGPRERKKITRRKTGCQTCRERKIKCSEEKPMCEPCKRAGVTCKGYGAQRRNGVWISDEKEEKKESPYVELSASTSSLADYPDLLSTFQLDDLQDLRLLNHFTQQTADHLSFTGHIGKTWSTVVPQLALDLAGSDSSHLIHALLAVSAAHIFSQSNGKEFDIARRGSHHYSQSVIALSRLIEAKSPAALGHCALAAVILLAWYETIYGDLKKALVHLKGASQIINVAGTAFLQNPTARVLFHLFIRLEQAACLVMAWPLPTTAEQCLIDSEIANYAANFNDESEDMFEHAWMEFTAIMFSASELRSELARGGLREASGRVSRGDAILKRMLHWRRNLPPLFDSVHPPLQVLERNDGPQLSPLYFRSFKVAVALCHYWAIQMNIHSLTRRADFPKPKYFYEAKNKILRACLGVQRMCEAGLWTVPSFGGDYGMLWPMMIGGRVEEDYTTRKWIHEWCRCWPREGFLCGYVVWWLVKEVWDRLDLGFGLEMVDLEDAEYAYEWVENPIKISVYERALSGPWQGAVRRVEINYDVSGMRWIQVHAWHSGEVPYTELFLEDRDCKAYCLNFATGQAESRTSASPPLTHSDRRSSGAQSTTLTTPTWPTRSTKKTPVRSTPSPANLSEFEKEENEETTSGLTWVSDQLMFRPFI